MTAIHRNKEYLARRRRESILGGRRVNTALFAASGGLISIEARCLSARGNVPNVTSNGTVLFCAYDAGAGGEVGGGTAARPDKTPRLKDVASAATVIPAASARRYCWIMLPPPEANLYPKQELD